ncbi:MAG: TylF/MycF family methyltransferase [candidate division Zixibacteria bacterium]|nr:TylF/MycF family methyltransferase [candidate division Zixibacteria bacterium]
MKELVSSWFLRPYFNQQQRRKIVQTGDPVRYGSILLALDDITKSGIVGSLAEVGVYRGTTSKFIHQIIPNRPFYLFDTFEGFHPRDLNNINHDERFRDTGVDEVVQIIGNTDNITIKKGYFPDTTSGLESETFAFVMIDLDKYDPTLAALKFFYPRINSGGYIFVHDYNSPESDWACSKALNRFLSDKPEKPIGIPDGWGTVLFRKF